MVFFIRQSLKDVVTRWYFWLFIITGIAIIIRSLPAWTNAAWGCDFGIYYGLTNSLVENKELFNPYYGWGQSYQYFPVLYAITGIAHWMTGIDVLTLMPKVAPIFGGLSVFVFYFLVNELLHNKKIALLASLFLAVMPFHVYQTSHASPLTVGHFFLMLSLYLFIKYRQDSRFLFPLFISTGLLIMSHHLTTYFYLISLIFIVFVENASAKEWTSTLKKDMLYILPASSLIFAYWIVIATPIYESFMNFALTIGPLSISPSLMIGLFYLSFILMFLLIWIKRRLNLFIVRGPPTARSALLKCLIVVSSCLVIMSVFSLVTLPWTNFQFTTWSIIYSIPLILIFGFAAAGIRSTRFMEHGSFIRGWLYALLLSFLFGLVTNSSVILPHRHLEYMMAPISILAIYGIRTVFLTSDAEKAPRLLTAVSYLKQLSSSFTRKPKVFQKRQILYLLVVLFLVTANAVSVYPSHVSLNASYEAITNEDLSVIKWMSEQVDKNTSIIASDHRIARLAEAVGFNTTLDQAWDIWTGENMSDYLDELQGVGKNYSKITHIVVDDIMRERVVHVGFGKIHYMTNESYEKFFSSPFELLYRNVTTNEAMEEVRWCEIYRVNWMYLEEHFVKHCE